MLRRRPGRSDAEDASDYSRRSAVADSVWVAQDRIRSGFGSAAEVAGRPFERVGYGLRKRVIWPLQDRAATMGAPARGLSAVAVLLVAAAAVAVGLNAATSGGTGETAAAPVAVTAAPTETKQAEPDRSAEPTLQGAAPVFKPAGTQPSEVDPAKAIVKSAPAETGSAEAAPASPAAASSSASKPAGESSAGDAAVDGPPAGPPAIAVARDFAGAFILYETGETGSEVREAFSETATPALSRALLKRPPRLPANVEVPKAKVLNVVAAPSHGDIYPVSVSLLRVGATSELRLDMEQQKGEGWRVTNVLG